MEQIKSQLITLFAVKNGNNSNSSLYDLIYGIICLTLIDSLVKYLPALGNFCTNYLKKNVEPNILKSLPIKPEMKSRIVFERSFADKRDDNIADALLDYISNLDGCQDLHYRDFYVANKKETFNVSSDITVRIIDKHLDKGVLVLIVFELASEKIGLTKLREWARDVQIKYEINKKNKFEHRRYYFDEIVSDFNGNLNWLQFSMSEFNTNKSLRNIYGEHMEILKKRVNLFTNNVSWYEEKGISHTLGILLHGPPGTGKTSTIKAIAKDTKRHIFNIKIRDSTTPEQMNDLFYNENVRVSTNNGFQMVTVPLNQRIYVIEDIDCLTNIVLSREYVEEKKVEKKDPYARDIPKKTPITLSYLLNLFDGVLETPGRILIMTSNYPEKLDKALIRPGRIDVNLRLGFCSCQTIKEMFEGFYGGKLDLDFEIFKDKHVTPAQVQERLCSYIEDEKMAFESLVKVSEEILELERIERKAEEERLAKEKAEIEKREKLAKEKAEIEEKINKERIEKEEKLSLIQQREADIIISDDGQISVKSKDNSEVYPTYNNQSSEILTENEIGYYKKLESRGFSESDSNKPWDETRKEHERSLKESTIGIPVKTTDNYNYRSTGQDRDGYGGSTGSDGYATSLTAYK
jgi:ABC-type dipeptide/oligopeptide/nickel transport system ATPase subunit